MFEVLDRAREQCKRAMSAAVLHATRTQVVSCDNVRDAIAVLRPSGKSVTKQFCPKQCFTCTDLIFSLSILIILSSVIGFDTCSKTLGLSR
jgi:hypothetical protein